MLGKRARQIRRTTSMSQLGPRYMFTEEALPSVGASNLPPRNPTSAAGGQKLSRPLGGRQDQSNQLQMVEIVEDDIAMGMNADQIACHDGGTQISSSFICTDGMLLAHESLTMDHSKDNYTSLDRSMQKPSHLPTQAGSWAHHMVSVPLQAKHQDAAFIRPGEFLNACFFCNKRLGHGRDIYMYRGDVAFCSEECRNHLISKDEQKDKCSVSASKKGTATPAVNIESGGKVVSSGTAVGA